MNWIISSLIIKENMFPITCVCVAGGERERSNKSCSLSSVRSNKSCSSSCLFTNNVLHYVFVERERSSFATNVLHGNMRTCHIHRSWHQCIGKKVNSFNASGMSNGYM
ncbi:hypothetical protein AMTRI_Chr03g143400 [Amborella trichopoda]